MHILITGGAGFIGSNIVKFLLDRFHKVRVIDNLSTGNMKNIEEFESNPNFEFIYGDITNLDDVRNVCKNIDVICHQAALGSVPRSINNPLASHNSNVNGFINILIAAKEARIKRVIYASSSAVYGNDEHLPKIESLIGTPLSPYAITKYVDELYAGIFTKLYGMECIGLRYFNVYGPKQDPNGEYAAVIPKFISMIKNNIQPTINGDGSFTRDFIYVMDVARANYLAMTTTNNKCYGNIFNIGTGKKTSIIELFSIIKSCTNSYINPLFGPNITGDIDHSVADINKTLHFLEFEAEYLLEKGIMQITDYY